MASALHRSRAEPAEATTLLAEPLGLLTGDAARVAIAAGLALPLAGGPDAFTLVRIGAEIMASPAAPAVWTAPLVAPVPPWAGFTTPQVMGILNVTPDSFSDGGLHLDPGRAAAVGLQMAADGAAIVDIGGETTRPGSQATDPEEERRRILPVIRRLAAEGVTVSADTRNAETMQAALDAGARIINDVSALAHDPSSASVIARAGCPVVLMHMRHTPDVMTQRARYDDVAAEVVAELAERVAAAEAAGIARANIAVDPGIGFGKTAAHNLELFPRLAMLRGLGCRVLVGVSRKGFIGKLADVPDPMARLPGSIAAGLHAVTMGATILRAHEVASTVQALKVWRGIGGIG